MKVSFCPNCGTEVSSEYTFCPKCGAKLPGIAGDSAADRTNQETDGDKVVICPTCGFHNEVGAGSCESCGTSLKGAQTVRGEVKPREAAPARQEPARKQKKEKKPVGPQASPKQNKFRLEPYQIAIIAAAVFLGAVLTYGIMTTRTSTPQDDNTGQQQNATGTQPSADILHEIDRLRQVVDKNPDDLGSTLRLANMLQDNSFYSQAAIYYKRYLDKVPTNADARVDYGVTLFEGGQTQDAINELLQAIKIDPKHQVAYFNLGIVYLNAQEFDKANDAFRKCVAIDPTTEIGKKAKQTLDEHMNMPNQQEVK